MEVIRGIITITTYKNSCEGPSIASALLPVPGQGGFTTKSHFALVHNIKKYSRAYGAASQGNNGASHAVACTRLE
jgi:hypothetical protein